MQITRATKANVGDIVKLSHGLFQEDAGQRDKTVNLNWATEHGHNYFPGFIEREQAICLLAMVDGMVAGYLAGYVSRVFNVTFSAKYFFTQNL